MQELSSMFLSKSKAIGNEWQTLQSHTPLNTEDEMSSGETMSTTALKTFDGNIVDYLFEKSLEPDNADRTAFVVGDAKHSFAQIHDRVNRLSNLLKSLGMDAGDRIMLSVIDGPDFPAIFLGTIKMGGIAVAINTYLKPADYEYYVNDSGARVLFIDHTLVPLIEEIKSNLRAIEFIVVCGRPAVGYPFLDDLLSAQPSSAQTMQRSGSDTAFLLYSSGSTGAPKGVIHTHSHIYWATELFGLTAQGIKAGDIIQCAPKMFFAFGLGNQVYFPLRAVATVIVNPEPATPARIWDLWLAHEPTVVMSVPTLYAGMLNLAETEIGRDRARRALHRLRFGVSGGEALPASLLEKWREFADLELLDGVGTTEMTHMFILNRPGRTVPGSCGKIVDGYNAVIVDEAGREVPVGDVGNLLVKGPTAMTGYWNKPEQTAATMRHGGVLTGDKFRIDRDGNYFLVGRSDDMLRVGGVWVSPIEIETVLCRFPGVLECAVVGIPDNNKMIKPKAFVVMDDTAMRSEDAIKEDLRDFCRTNLAHIKCPRWIDIVSDLPKTATGKIQRFRLRQTIEA